MSEFNFWMIMFGVYVVAYYVRDLRRLHKRVKTLSPECSCWATWLALGLSKRLLVSTSKSVVQSMCALVGVSIVSGDFDGEGMQYHQKSTR
ncbi:hypothetical protein [Congregibacter litoralis]|uniref:Uncharacterized protein n=1 Tax=Congregibacter litoralis KT71 TaxID=314285 RepID=A4A4L8_9GAMM|nr:hypothetical protein [Congregibacter litoralis]EAQ98739.2 hypothetical protein KT71_08937 [Congregibacter litoralis KT71]